MKNLMTSIRSRREQGNALVLVISFIFIIGMIIALLVAIVIDANGKATSTRANAQAVAAAEGGVDLYLQHLLAMEGACYAPGSGTYGSDTADVEYKVLATKYTTGNSEIWKDCTPGESLVGKNVSTLMVKVSGRAEDQTRSRESANEATVERVLGKSEGLGLSQAIFGKSSLTTKAPTIVNPDVSGGEGKERPGDVVTEGFWNCPSDTRVSGDVVALGGASLKGCRIGGDLLVKGTPDLPSQLEVGGNLYILGSLDSTASIKVGGSILVTGDYIMGGGQQHVVGGDIRALGAFKSDSESALAKVQGNLYLGLGMKDPKHWGTKQTFINNASKIRYNLLASGGTNGPDWQMPTILTGQYSEEDLATLNFPMLRTDNEVFSSYVRRTWKEITPSIGRQDCLVNGINRTIHIEQDTLIDASNCDMEWMSAATPIEVVLDANLAIFVKSFTSKVNVNIVGGKNSGSKGRPTLYIVAVPSPAQTTCPSNPSASFTLASGIWNSRSSVQDRGDAKVLFYSGGLVDIRSNTSIDGQIYGCSVSTPPGFTVRYAPVGEDESALPFGLRQKWTRDITN